MIRLALRSLAARRGRTLLSIIGVALGIGVLYASLATDAGISAAIDRTVRRARRTGGPPGRGVRARRALAGEPRGRRGGAGRRGRGAGAPAADLPGGDGATAGVPAGPGDAPRHRSRRRRPGPRSRRSPPAGRSAAAGRGGRRSSPSRSPGPTASRRAARSRCSGRTAPWTCRSPGSSPATGRRRGAGGGRSCCPLATMQRILGDDTVSRVDVLVGQGATTAETIDAIGVALTGQPYVLSSPRRHRGVAPAARPRTSAPRPR